MIIPITLGIMSGMFFFLYIIRLPKHKIKNLYLLLTACVFSIYNALLLALTNIIFENWDSLTTIIINELKSTSFPDSFLYLTHETLQVIFPILQAISYILIWFSGNAVIDTSNKDGRLSEAEKELAFLVSAVVPMLLVFLLRIKSGSNSSYNKWLTQAISLVISTFIPISFFYQPKCNRNGKDLIRHFKTCTIEDNIEVNLKPVDNCINAANHPYKFKIHRKGYFVTRGQVVFGSLIGSLIVTIFWYYNGIDDATKTAFIISSTATTFIATLIWIIFAKGKISQ